MCHFSIRIGTKALRCAVLTVFLLLTVTAAGQATPLDVPLEPYPVILVGLLQINYVAGLNGADGSFTATGWTQGIDKGTGQSSFMNRFTLNAKIDALGKASSGSFAVGDGGSLLRSSTLLQFGFQPSPGGVLEFLFSAPSGSLAETQPLVYGPTPVDVMFYSVGPTFTGSWTSSWSSVYKATAEIRSEDSGPTSVPEPSTLLLVLVSLGAGVGARRFRHVAS